MNNGLSDGSAGVERCDVSRSKQSSVKDEVQSLFLTPKHPTKVSDAAFTQFSHPFTSPFLQVRHNITNSVAFRMVAQVLSSLDGDNFIISASKAEEFELLSTIPLGVPESFSKPFFISSSSPIHYTPFSCVRALSSSVHNGSDKPVITPNGHGEDELAGHTTSLNSFQHIDHADVVPVTPRGRSNMTFISPIQREGEFICGWGAAFINICVTFPINKAIFRQQLHGISGLKAIRQLRKDGLHYLYRGLLPPLLQKTMSLSVMFGMYFHCQDVIKEHFPKLGVLPNHAIAAMISGTLEATFMPFERIQTLMQNREFHNRFANTPDAFRHVWSYGFKEYYRGLSLIIWRNGPSNVAFFLGREYIQDITPQPASQTKKMLKDFLSGACLGAMISTVFFPLNVVKTRMQSQLGGAHESGWATLKVLLAERKGRLKELFKGVHLNYTRSFISWGIINASFEVLIKLYNGESWSKVS